MLKTWNKWVRFVEKKLAVETSIIKRMAQILLFYLLSVLLAHLASKIAIELGIIILLLTLILSALIIITLLYSVAREIIIDTREMITDTKTKSQENE